MKIVICGCGKIGKTVLSYLVKEEHDVVAIDSNPTVVEHVNNSFDVRAILANGTEYGVLKEAGVDKADLFIATTDSDEVNMLVCYLAKKMGADHTVARIRDLGHNEDNLAFLRRELGIDLIVNPEKAVAEAIFNILKLPTASKVETFSSRQIELVECYVKKSSKYIDKPLFEIRKSVGEKFLVAVLKRGDEVIIPNGNFILKEGDKIGIVALSRSVNKAFDIVGEQSKPLKNVMIMGGGRISCYLAEMLLSARNGVKMIEKSPEVCDKILENLPESLHLIKGDGMDQTLLSEEGISSTDAFVALTGRDEDNILISFYARSKNVPKVVAKVNDDGLASISEKLGLESSLSTKNITADIVVKYARALEKSKGSHIETLYSVMGGRAEVLEFRVLEGFKETGIPVKDLKIAKGVLIAGIIRGRTALIPSGNDVIFPEDKVVIITSEKGFNSLSDIFE